MRKQILSGLIAAVALLFSVVALTSAPASGQDYSSYPAQNGATISGVVPDELGPCPCEVTVTFANGVSVSTMTAADGSFTLTIPAGAAGVATVTSGGVVLDTFEVNAPVAAPVDPTATVVVVNPNPTPVVVNPVATAAPATVVPANNFGFNGQGVPTTPALAVTGTDTGVLGFIATGLIALGAVAMGSRRKFLQGALED